MANAIEDAMTLAPNNGDVLVFLPGVKEIKNVRRELLEDSSRRRRMGIDDDDDDGVELLTLYGSLPKQEQDYVVFPPPQESLKNRRRIILSSPIAEASLTLQGVTCVVDSGLRREPRCDVDTGMPKLVTVRCSRASAKQRAGRAGRLQPGLCVRIYSEQEFLGGDNKFMDHSMPEIWSSDLTPMTLLLIDWGCGSIVDVMENVPFVDRPKVEDLNRAFELLVNLGAVEQQQQQLVDTTMPTTKKKKLKKEEYRYKITNHGRVISKMPIHPRLATAIAKASSSSMLVASVTAAFLLDDETGSRGGGGGIFTTDLAPRVHELLLNNGHMMTQDGKNLIKFASRVSKEAREAVQRVMEHKESIPDVIASLGEALLPGYIDLVAQKRGDASYGGSTYMLSLGRSARLDKPRGNSSNSDAAPNFAIVLDTSTGDDGKTRIRSYVTIHDGILRREDVSVEKDVVFTVPSRGHEVRARRVRTVGALELSSVPTPTPPSPDDVAGALLDAIRSIGGVYKALYPYLSNEKKTLMDNLRSRVRLGRTFSSAGGWPACFAALDVTTNWNGKSSSANDDSNDDDIITMSMDEAEDILETLVEPWLAPAGSLKNVDLHDILLGSMATEQQYQLDNDFPTFIKAPDSSNIPISYSTGTPTASAKLQQFFGTLDSPRVGPQGAMPVTLSLLSPGGKLLAQTVDLPFFWKETYPTVRAENRGRYAKHPWPENPLSAVATRHTKKYEAASAVTSKEGGTIDKRKEKRASKKKKRKR
uniref:Helicase C-terminal domain-containing protein n=2 Tax=Ditylum brightwellii TaxID=49249 RepID=A0A7S1Z6U6_9STRA